MARSTSAPASPRGMTLLSTYTAIPITDNIDRSPTASERHMPYATRNTQHITENPADISIKTGRAQAYKLYLSKASLPPAEDRCQRSNPIPYFTLGKRSPFIRGQIRPHAPPPFAAFIASTIVRMVGRLAEIGVGCIHLGDDIGYKTGRTSRHGLIPR